MSVWPREQPSDSMDAKVTCGNACPVCGEPNNCRMAGGCADKTACWCEQVTVLPKVLRVLADSDLAQSCLCRRCLTSIARHLIVLNDPPEILARVRGEIALTSTSQHG